jgi:hypothetical protein
MSNNLLTKEEQEGHLAYPKVLLSRKSKQSQDQSLTQSLKLSLSADHLSNESKEHGIMMRRLAKLRKRVVYFENVSSRRSTFMSQMAHQLAIDEFPECELDTAMDSPNDNDATDMYSLVSDILQRSQKAVLENEREEKNLQNLSNVVRLEVFNRLNSQKLFYSKLVNFWKILFPESERPVPESVDELADSIGEILIEFKKESENTKDVGYYDLFLEISKRDICKQKNAY